MANPNNVPNAHVLFGTPWASMTPDDQTKLLAQRVPYYPTGPTTQGYNTPPMSPAMRTPTCNTGMDTIMGGPSGSARTPGATRSSLTPGPYVAAMRAELAAQQQEGKVTNAHLMFGTHTWQPQGGSDEAPPVNLDRLNLRAAHQEGEDSM